MTKAIKCSCGGNILKSQDGMFDCSSCEKRYTYCELLNILFSVTLTVQCGCGGKLASLDADEYVCEKCGSVYAYCEVCNEVHGDSENDHRSIVYEEREPEIIKLAGPLKGAKGCDECKTKFQSGGVL